MQSAPQTRLCLCLRYLTYEDQLQELDLITQRIANLTDALKRRGVYDASFSELQRLATATDNEFVPCR